MVFVDENCENFSLHTVCDASQHAYAVATFVIISTDNGVEVHLLAAKSRGALAKIFIISRLQLIAATMVGLHFQNVNSYFWKDCSTVLIWIQREESWTLFERNRVKAFRKTTDSNSWKHVPWAESPADADDVLWNICWK